MFYFPEIVLSASVSSAVESSMDLSHIFSDTTEPAAAPPDLVVISTASLPTPEAPSTEVAPAAPVDIL